MKIEYIGENTFLGQLGYFFIFLAFCSAVFSALSYFFAVHKKDEKLKTWGKIGFRVHSLSLLAIIGILFYIILNNHFEYHYAWKHSSTSLPVKYILSCFWEGQEGSFILWMFWHVVLGNILILKSGKWEAPVMTVFAVTQVFLATMILGIYIPEFLWFKEYAIGANPFILLREHPDLIGMPFTQSPNYLQSIEGNGLNPLLQNYWMTIHPPTLFLGFASTLVPFAYAIAGLWTKKNEGMDQTRTSVDFFRSDDFWHRNSHGRSLGI